jgi:hypothetical protein
MQVTDLMKKYGSTISPLLSAVGTRLGGLPDGNVFFVDSGATRASDTADGFHGQMPDTPFATIDYAIGKCTANNGDVIVVAPGHNEVLGNDGAIEIDVAGITILGLGTGSDRPTIDFDHATATVSVRANNVRLINLLFNPSVTAVAIGVEIQTGKTGIVIEDCEFAVGEDGAGTDEFVIALKLDGGNTGTTVKGCKFYTHASAAHATHAISIAAACNQYVIEDCIIRGAFATGGIVEAAAGADVIIRNNEIKTTGTNISLNASTTAGRYGNTADGASEDSGANFIGVDDSDNAIATTNVVANQDGSILERLEQIQEAVNIGTGTSLGENKSLVDALGTNGVTVTDSAVSVLGAIGANSANNAFDSSTVAANADGSMLERLEYVQTTMAIKASIPQCIEKSDGAVLAGTDDLFTIAGGPVLAQVFGIVTTEIGGAANGTLQITTTVPAATANLSTTVAIDNDAAGTSYQFVGATGVLTPTTAGAAIIDPVTVDACWFLCPIGTVKFLGSDAQSGVIKWYMRYVPLSPSSTVTAAA